MLRTRSGYCGGKKESPNYYAIGDHTEAVSIDFDPKVTSYEKLLDKFWEAHRCGSAGGQGQYMVAVFYHNEEQKKVAEKSRRKAAKREGISMAEVKTPVLPLGVFTYAEGYHQKYYLRKHTDVREFLEKTYPTPKALADSTVATRLNAFLGWGFDRDVKVLEKEIDGYGLPEGLKKEVLARMKKG